jgi:alanyl-tRNA synthetase
MTGVNDIRSTFLDYFSNNDHQVVESGPLVPRNDPTLMFANAGMNQFKDVFVGKEKRGYKRAATSQKCVRAGGKHNDLDNVGYTARHHTFFEMLGNFSFGDYFKERAIELAWNLITKEYGLDKDKLLVTVYHTDDQAFDLWRKIAGLPQNKIIRIPTSDNFWAMGDTGPCGPCSEIFYDHGDHIPGGPPGSPDEDGDRFIEIWNLVFMQYEQKSPEERIELPRPSIDTGMGLERISAVLQGTHDNYETDLFRSLIATIVEHTGVPAEGANKASNRVIADHLRATSFLIADGVLPSNEGRGYVLRRIMRRAMRHIELLGVKEPMMWKLFPALEREMGHAYPQLGQAADLITETLKGEEIRFRKTLARGLKMLGDESSGLAAGDKFSGDVAFRLYDTYGFPLDLTQDALRAREIEVDTSAFDAAMEQQKATARAAWAGSGEAATEQVWFDIKEGVGGTDFLGYDTEKSEAIVKAIVCDGKPVDKIAAGEQASVITNQTPFYGESGGQSGDCGIIQTDGGCVFKVEKTLKKLDSLFVHSGVLESGTLEVEMPVEMLVDHRFRSGNRIHHSATHLLHEALRMVLGNHVAQKGSLVEPSRLRFDFSHPKSMSAEELKKAEQLANRVVQQNSEVSTRLMGVDEAVEAGAMALFGEKYGDEVRVVSMGEGLPEQGGQDYYSLELCGGTHVSRTGDIGLIKVTAESATSSGVRRIEAVAGEAARRYFEQRDRQLSAVAGVLKVAPGQVKDRVENLLSDRKQLEKELAEARKKLALGGGTSGGDDAVEEINGIKFLGKVLDGINAKELRGMIDDAKTRLGSGVIVLITTNEGKAGVSVGVTSDLTDKINAVDLVRAAAAAVGGKGGGGRPDMAQAGGPEGAKADDALDAVRKQLSI